MTYTHTDGTTRDVEVLWQTWAQGQQVFTLHIRESIGNFHGNPRSFSIYADLAQAFWDQYNSDEALQPALDLALGLTNENDLRALWELPIIENPLIDPVEETPTEPGPGEPGSPE